MGKKKAEDILSEDKGSTVNQSNGEQDKQASLAKAIVKTLKNVSNKSLSNRENMALWNKIQLKTKHKKNIKFSLRKLVVAAIFLFVIGIILYLYNVTKSVNDIQQVAIVNQKYLSESADVQLINADKKKQVLHDTLFVYHQLVKQVGEIANQHVRYNSVGVPYGKRSELILEDGTRVWLNAGSTLTFPEKFDDREREVYLEGEGYFEVAKDAKRPFLVQSEVMKIQVLGTSFNLSSYSDDDYTSVVLLTGSIALLPNGNRSFEKQLLKPGMEARFGKSQYKLQIQPTTEASISWTKKRLLLNSMGLEEILKKLERFYNAKIDVSELVTMDETFSGSLDLTQTLPEVLQNVLDVSKYTINQIGRRVYINTK